MSSLSITWTILPLRRSGLPQPRLNPAVLFAALLGVVGSDRQVYAESSHQCWANPSPLQLLRHRPRAVPRKHKIRSRVTIAVREAKEEELPSLVRWISQDLNQPI